VGAPAVVSLSDEGPTPAGSCRASGLVTGWLPGRGREKDLPLWRLAAPIVRSDGGVGDSQSHDERGSRVTGTTFRLASVRKPSLACLQCLGVSQPAVEFNEMNASRLRSVAVDVTQMQAVSYHLPPWSYSEEEIAGYSTELERHLELPGFRATTAREGGRLVGVAYGFPGPERIPHSAAFYGPVVAALGRARADELLSGHPLEVIQVMVEPASGNRSSAARAPHRRHRTRLAGYASRVPCIPTLPLRRMAATAATLVAVGARA